MSGLLISVVMNLVFFLVIAGMSFLLLMIKKHTPAMSMYKAKMKGIPLCIFFNDDKTFEMRPIKPDSGTIQHDKYGIFTINEEGSYLDKNNKFVVLPFSSSVGITIPAKFAKVTDSLRRLMGDEKQVNKFRTDLMNGTLERRSNDLFHQFATNKIKFDKVLSPEEKQTLLKQLKKEKFNHLDVIRESINYSSIKSMVNSFTPQNINNKINMTVARKMATFGDEAMKYMVILLVTGIFVIGLLGFVLYMFNNPSPEKIAMAKALAQAAQPVVVGNASVLG